MRAIFFALTFGLTLPEVVASEIPGSKFYSGNWSGAGYTSDVDGSFSHCGVYAPYVRGETLHFSVNNDGTMSLGIANESWKMDIGQRLDISVTIDNYSPDYSEAIVVHSDFAVATLPTNNGIFEKVRRGHNMRVRTIKGYLDFSLEGTSKALAAAYQCALAYSTRPPQGGGELFPAAVGDGVSTGANASAVDRAELLTLMTNILSESGVTGYKILRPDQVPETLRGYPVVWSADDVIGFLTAVRMSPGGNVQAMGPGVIAGDAGACKGKFASGSIQNSSDASTLFTACYDSKNSWKIDYTIVAANGYAYMFAVAEFIDEETVRQRGEKRTVLSDELFRTASYTLDRPEN
jgi:hypothetical protein